MDCNIFDLLYFIYIVNGRDKNHNFINITVIIIIIIIIIISSIIIICLSTSYILP